MTRPARETSPMPLVDCPLCDRAIPFDPDADAIDCVGCDALLPFAPDPAVQPGSDLPLAA